ncbi:fimbria/pilus outer membrane usher protein [Serratia fonticola]|uniref:fimbria/pilus outer membrane usher protein n=1 Tax=Serratia fonticola TaxID=47917 RepID=UPI002097F19C|nr:fimbria/pilus outer membrane usher protein [Serratia fonticola]MCO7508349.1 fimbria/pilus outer membrane usher protein [Serratia fonticola]
MNQGWFAVGRIALLVCLSLATEQAAAVEFNTDVLDTEDKANIDFSRFSQVGYVLPGVYQMRITLNGDSWGNEIGIPFYLPDAEPGATKDTAFPQACLPPNVVEHLGLLQSAQEQLTYWHDGECVDFSALKGTLLTPNVGAGTLNINMPQAWLEYSDASWLPPSRWDHGLSGMMLDYNTNVTTSRQPGQGQQQRASINGTVGANLDAWRLRADYQANYNRSAGSHSSTDSSFEFSRVYLFRPIPQWQSTLTMGENYVNSQLFDSWRYAGLALASDDQMLPPRLRGYAPEIIGVAKTDALVTVTQQGRVVYESTVPAGPFRIQSLDNTIRGTLDVKVTEQSGEERTFSVSTASVPYLTRPGQIRYQVMAGRPSSWQHDIEGPTFASGEMAWGISNAWSVYGGATMSREYQALALGAGRDLFLMGALALDVTQSMAKFQNGQDLSGKSWRLSYSKYFDVAQADVTFAGYRFSEKDYMSMQQFLDTRYHGGDREHQKERYQINANKRFDALSIGLNYERQTYWDRGDTRQYGVNVGSNFDLLTLGLRTISLNATVARSQYMGRQENLVSLMLSMPLGSGSISANSTYSGKRYGHRLGYYDRVGLDSYSVNAGFDYGNNQRDGGQFSGMYTHNGGIGSLSANVALETRGYSSLGFSANGGVTATGKGVAMHSGGYNGRTRLMVDTDGVSGVPVDGGRVVTNSLGIGVLANVNSYYRTTARIDVNKLADDVEATQGVMEIALTEGAIGYRKFAVVKGAKAFAVLRLANGDFPPFGASVNDPKGREVGIVADGGLAWLTGISPQDRLSVGWDGEIQCYATLPQILDQDSLLLPCRK